MLWESLTGEESVETFLHKDNGLRAHQERKVECLATLEHFGDFFLSGQALEDAFDICSRLINVCLNVTNYDTFFLDEGLVRFITKCAQSAESLEQKKLAFELPEHCLLHDSITGRFSDTMCGLLRRCYTSKYPSRQFDMPECIEGWSKEKSSRISGWTLSALQTMDMTIAHSWPKAADPSELCHQIQHSIYLHLWQVGRVDRASLSASLLASEKPSSQECQIYAALSHILADVMVGKLLTNSSGRIGVTGDLAFKMKDFPIWLVENEAHAKEELEEMLQHVRTQGSGFLKFLLSHSGHSSDLRAQCTQSLREQALEAVDTSRHLSKRGDLSLNN